MRDAYPSYNFLVNVVAVSITMATVFLGSMTRQRPTEKSQTTATTEEQMAEEEQLINNEQPRTTMIQMTQLKSRAILHIFYEE